MSRWTHSICDDCWDKQHPDKQSHRLQAGDLDLCCWCDTPTYSGIYLRHDPTDTELTCKGGGRHRD